MATVREHERNRLHLPGRPIWLRVLVYARPYIGLVALTLGLTLMVSLLDFGRAYLIKPVLDDVVLPHSNLGAGIPAASWLPDFGLFSEEEKPAQAPEPAAPVQLDDAERAELQQTIRQNLMKIALAAAVIVVFLPLMGFFREYTTAYALGRISVDMKRDVCAKVLALPLRFHHMKRRGDVYTRVVSDVGVAHSAIGLIFSDVAQAVLRITVGMAFLFYVSWQLALTVFVIGPLIFGVITLFGKRIRRTAKKRQAQVAEVTQRLMEILSGIKVIKAFRAEAAEDAAYRRETRKLFKRSMKVVKNRLLSRHLIDFLNQFTTVGVLGLGLVVLFRGTWSLTPGDLVVFFLISSQTYRPFKRLAKAWARIMDSYAGAERFLEVMDAPVEIRDAPDAVAIGPLCRGVAMRGICFAYRDAPVLRDVSFEAKAGEVVAVVGRTGAGKTTLIDLLLRFYDPDEGCIEIDGVDLRRVSRDSLLGQIAVVAQEPFLFDGTIRENLQYGKLDAIDDEVFAAARAAHVDEFVHELSEGYDTEVGSSGVRLSGGQRQRITIARAILKDPSILILDEATSSLDSKSEKYVQEAIDALLGGNRTVFVIAHRLSTIRRADRILVLENGRITQQGTHQELILSGGLYAELLELQTSGYDDTPAAQ
ncbi:MAG: ABC transporter ATP-binding protein [Deltaproteobacteria bacterium]|nr:ABC transporter ATP-binding protein [Deltaproteobacteria bacterium]